MTIWNNSKKLNTSTKSVQKTAFTLAEVLITLGIIGIVAAITIPTLIANKAKQETVTKLQKSYTVIAQAVKLSENDNGSNSTWDWGLGGTLTPQQSFATYWAPYLKTANFCTSGSVCGYGTITRFKGRNGIDSYNITRSDGTTVILSDGSLMEIVAFQTPKLILVDINASGGPNTLGKDVFLFSMDPDKGLMPFGYTSNSDCAINSNGWYCAAKIIKDGWQIKDDYPW